MKPFQVAFCGSWFVPEAHGFYEAHEGILGVAFRPRRRFEYSLEAERMSVELDKKGELAHIEVRCPKENWLLVPRLVPPQSLYRSRAFFPVPASREGEEYLANLAENILCVEFSTRPAWRAVEIADTLTAEISADFKLLRLWILKIAEDFGNKKELAWLKAGQLYLPQAI
ncbi:MAG: hypothetical protein L0Z48_03295 [candidate division Zixibacteria bacterium]|nr:hypothetical protein [candidate division Zixibacteria bacterium]